MAVLYCKRAKGNFPGKRKTQTARRSLPVSYQPTGFPQFRITLWLRLYIHTTSPHLNPIRSENPDRKPNFTSESFTANKPAQISKSPIFFSIINYFHIPADERRKFTQNFRVKMTSSVSKAWAVATSVAAVEALKDQGFCRWNYTIRSLHHHAKNKIKSVTQDAKKKMPSTQSTAVIGNKIARESEKIKLSTEESMRTVMYLSSWGPN